jgi:cytochrome c peroxidase
VRKDYFIGILLLVLLVSCRKDEGEYIPTPYVLEIPEHFPQMNIPSNNPMTVEGVRLGRKLFYEELLSGDASISCATCHMPDEGFADSDQFSEGITGEVGKRNSMALVNMGWQQFFFWDGRASTLENQIFRPVTDPVEMNETWPNVVHKLEHEEVYEKMFLEAFGSYGIDSVRVSKAIAQFIRTMISSNSQYDILYKEKNGFVLSAEEQAIFNSISFDAREGYNSFENLSGADCFHCHNGFNLQVQKFSNNGLDATFTDHGRMDVTGNPNDDGRFKVPSLRNIGFSAPYMHDGRFETLEDVVDHYSSGIVMSPTIDPGIEFASVGGVQLDAQQRLELLAFLKTFNDTSFITNPAFQDPD